MNNLQPASIWSHFATLCAIPRPSGHEAALRNHLAAWAQAHGIEAVADPVGNLILKKPASPGAETRPGVALQGHLDMVCQANAGTAHDFERDPIRPALRDGWLVAEATTLGADNGIGVALALAALTEPGLAHPPLEVLLTVNEEAGMFGVRGLAPGTLHGTALINLDTEEWGHFYLGCAGGLDVRVCADPAQAALPPGHATWRIEVSGLCGGHSGIDIHRGRGNAIKLLAAALRDLAGRHDLRLGEFVGGSAHNAIPREAYAMIALPADAAAGLAAWTQACQADWRRQYAEADPSVSLTCTPCTPAAAAAVSAADRDRLLAFLAGVSNGVATMSDAFPGVVETSSSLGVARLDHDGFEATLMVRSLKDEQAQTLAGRLVAEAATHGLQAWGEGPYPGWTPNPASPLLALCQRVYQAQSGCPANVQVIHAGLECGLLAASHPGLDMISFGPDIRGAHAPGERVEIASVARCWDLLKGVLRALAAS